MNTFTRHGGGTSGSRGSRGGDTGDYGYLGGSSSSGINSNSNSNSGNYAAPPPPPPHLLLGNMSDDPNSHFLRAIVIILIVASVLTISYVLLVLLNRYCCCCCPKWLKPSEFFLAELSIRGGEQQQGDSNDAGNDIILQEDDIETGYSTATRSREAMIQSSSNNSTRRENDTVAEIDASSSLDNNNNNNNSSPSILPLDIPGSSTRRSTTIAALRQRDHPNQDFTFQSLSLVDLNQLELLNRITWAQIQATASLSSFRIDHQHHHRNETADSVYINDGEWQPPFLFSSLTLFERKTLLQYVLGKSVYIHPKQRPRHAPDKHVQSDKKQPKIEDEYSAGVVDGVNVTVKGGGASSHAESMPSSSLSTEQTSDENDEKYSQLDALDTTPPQEYETEDTQNEDDLEIEGENTRPAHAETTIGTTRSDKDVDRKEYIQDATASTTLDDQDDEDDGICGICLSEYHPGTPILASPHCQHAFHYHCIMNWLARSKDDYDYHYHTNASCYCCPFCRCQMVTLPELQHAAQQVMNPNRLAQLGILPKVCRKARAGTTPSLPTLITESPSRTSSTTTTSPPPIPLSPSSTT